MSLTANEDRIGVEPLPANLVELVTDGIHLEDADVVGHRVIEQMRVCDHDALGLLRAAIRQSLWRQAHNLNDLANGFLIDLVIARTSNGETISVGVRNTTKRDIASSPSGLRRAH